jgi:hypothetical protein
MVEKMTKIVPDTSDEDSSLEMEIIFKPRTDFSTRVLKKVVPKMNQKKQKSKLTQNIKKFNS